MKCSHELPPLLLPPLLPPVFLPTRRQINKDRTDLQNMYQLRKFKNSRFARGTRAIAEK